MHKKKLSSIVTIALAIGSASVTPVFAQEFQNSGDNTEVVEQQIIEGEQVTENLITEENQTVEEEITEPKIKSVTVDKTSVQPGESFEIYLDIDYDPSLISRVEVNYGDSNDTSSYRHYAEYDSESGKWVVTTNPLYEEVELGTWDVKYIKLYYRDTTNNYKSKSYTKEVDYTSPSILVEYQDKIKPVFNGVEVSKKQISEGTLRISINAQDESELYKGRYKSSVIYNTPDGPKNIDLEYNEITNKLEGFIDINKKYNGQVEKWILEEIHIYDNSRNELVISSEDRDLSEGNFEVINTTVDNLLPEFISVQTDKEKVLIGESIYISIEANDSESGPRRAEIVYIKPDGDIETIDLSYDRNTNRLEGEIWDSYFIGKWTIDQINIYDNAGNKQVISKSDRDLSEGNFEVIKRDSIAPKFNSVNVDKTRATADEIVKISVDAEDVEPGIKSIVVTYKNTKSAWDDSRVTLTYNEESKKYIGYIMEIDKYNTASGKWEIYNIALEDGHGNVTTIYNSNISDEIEAQDLSGGDFEVYGTVLDKTAPIIKSVQVDKDTVTEGERLKITIDAEDNESGLGELKLIEDSSWGGYFSPQVVYITPVTKDEYYLDLKYNSVTNKYEGYIDIDKYLSEPGEWKIKSIWIFDKNGNESRTYNSNSIEEDYYQEIMDLSGGNFKVDGTILDTTAPIIKSVSIDKTTAKVGETVKIVIDAEDKDSGLSSLKSKYDPYGAGHYETQAHVVYKTQGTKMSRRINLYYNEETNKYEGDINIDTQASPWEIEYIEIYDKSGNVTRLFNSNISRELESQDLSGADIFVEEGENVAPVIPEVKSIKVEKDILTVGDRLKISLEVKDDKSEVVSVSYIKPITGVYTDIYLKYNEETRKYEGYIDIDNSIESGQWRLNRINLRDGNRNNYTIYDFYDNVSLFDGNFTVTGTNADTYKPYINSIKVNKSEVTVGETVKIIVEAGDNESSVDNVKVGIRKPRYGSSFSFLGDYITQYVDLSYNEETKVYEYDMNIDKFDNFGLWSIFEVIATDKFGNENELQLENEVNFWAFGNYIEDNIKPKLNSISIDKKFVTVGDKIKVTIDARDDESGIKDVSLNYIISNEEYYLNLIYNKETGMYEGYIDTFNYPGQWIMDNIFITDDRDNRLDIRARYSELFDLSKYNFYVSDVKINLEVTKEINDKTVEIIGKSEPGLKIIASVNGEEIGQVVVNESGNYTIEISPQKQGTQIEILAMDSEGNKVKSIGITVIDTTAPEAPKVNEISDKSEEITGTTEAGATIIAKVNGDKIGEAIADENGNFIISISRQSVGKIVEAIATDNANNSSIAAKIEVKNETPSINLANRNILVNKENVEDLDIIKSTGAKAIDKEDGDLDIKITGFDSSRIGEQTVTVETIDSNGQVAKETVTVKVVDIKDEISIDDSKLYTLDLTSIVDGLGTNANIYSLSTNIIDKDSAILKVAVRDQYGNKVEDTINVTLTKESISLENSIIQPYIMSAIKGDKAYIKFNIKKENINTLTSAYIQTNDGKKINLKVDTELQIINLSETTNSFKLEYVLSDTTYVTDEKTIEWTEKQDTTQPSKVDVLVEELVKESSVSIEKPVDKQEVVITSSKEVVVGLASEILENENTSISVNDGILEIKVENTIIKASEEKTTIEKGVSEKYEITSDGKISKYMAKAPAVQARTMRSFGIMSITPTVATTQWELVYTIDTKQGTIQHADGKVEKFQPSSEVQLIVDAKGDVQEPVLNIIKENNDQGNTKPEDNQNNNPVDNNQTNDNQNNNPINNNPVNNEEVKDTNGKEPIENKVIENNNSTNENIIKSELPKTGENMIGSLATMIFGAASMITGGSLFRNRRNK